jgi:hypothetical protein
MVSIQDITELMVAVKNIQRKCGTATGVMLSEKCTPTRQPEVRDIQASDAKSHYSPHARVYTQTRHALYDPTHNWCLPATYDPTHNWCLPATYDPGTN